jgi:hypothetical protein
MFLLAAPCFALAASCFALAAPCFAAPRARHTAPDSAPGGLVIRAGNAPEGEAMLDPESRAWEQMPVSRVGLNRTPPLYDTDPPADLEIPVLEVRAARAGLKMLVHLSWPDATGDSATIGAMPATPYETRSRKEQSQATDRFFDAAAVMLPENPSQAGVSPSLQMGDEVRPVTIYYWNAARGPMRMQSRGRGTTRRTGETFPSRAVYRSGTWQVTMELPAAPAGVPLAFAVWNGSQDDRDGRKYFSVWHHLEQAP